MLKENRKALDALSDLLFANETVDGSEVYELAGRPQPTGSPGVMLAPQRAGIGRRATLGAQYRTITGSGHQGPRQPSTRGAGFDSGNRRFDRAVPTEPDMTGAAAREDPRDARLGRRTTGADRLASSAIRHPTCPSTGTRPGASPRPPCAACVGRTCTWQRVTSSRTARPRFRATRSSALSRRPDLAATRFVVGDRVGAAWLAETCGTCKYCVLGRENLCLEPRFTGWDVDGGFAEYMVANEAFLYRLPVSFDDEAVAPLLCAGIIGYRSLLRADLPSGGRLGLYGFGGSAHITAQVALADGATVYVFTRSAEDQALARALGAAFVGGAADDPPEPLDAAI